MNYPIPEKGGKDFEVQDAMTVLMLFEKLSKVFQM